MKILNSNIDWPRVWYRYGVEIKLGYSNPLLRALEDFVRFEEEDVELFRDSLDRFELLLANDNASLLASMKEHIGIHHVGEDFSKLTDKDFTREALNTRFKSENWRKRVKFVEEYMTKTITNLKYLKIPGDGSIEIDRLAEIWHTTYNSR